jgi:predicted porin
MITPFFSLAAATYYTDNKTAGQHPIDFGINAAYYLSKRTSLYAEVSYVKNSHGSNLGVNGYGTQIVPGANQTGVAVGITHLF